MNVRGLKVKTRRRPDQTPQHPFFNRPPDVMAAHAAGRKAGTNSDFESRVLSKRVDLVTRIEEGLPPIAYLPESDGMLIRGKRHIIAAPRKEGKSIAMLVHWARMALAEAHVIVLDRENGANEYARRLDAIMAAWGLGQRDKTRLKRKLHYYEFPHLRPEDGPELTELAAGADIVCFDSQRMFLTDFNLKEGDADDYSEFMSYAIEPLFKAGIATVILDNTGHTDKSRSRGTSAKGDLNEVLFTLKAEEGFSVNRQGKLRLTLAPGSSRFGNEGEWVMHIGGGAFSPWQRADDEKPIDPAFRRAAEQALNAAGLQGHSQTTLLDAIRRSGVAVTNSVGRDWLYRLARDPVTGVELVPPDGPGLPAMFYGGPAKVVADEAKNGA